MEKEIKSPCINVCKYNKDHICMGCYRSMDEITGWLFMDNKRKQEILENVRIRRETPETEINDYDYYV